MSEKAFIPCAQKIQNLHYELLHGTSYDLIQKNALNKFGDVLCNYLPKKEAIPLSKKIIQNGSDLVYRILIVHCIVDDSLLIFPVIRVYLCQKGDCVFYDHMGRMYCNWNDYLCNNKLPEGVMIYPVNGNYSKSNGNVLIETKKSPAGMPLSKVGKYLYVAAEIVCLISAGLPLFSFSKPYANQISIASGVSNGYKAGYHGYQLYDRYKHKESVDFSDEDALLHWSHLGNAFLTFGLTHYRCSYGNPSKDSDNYNFQNMIQIFLKEINKPNRGVGALYVFKQKLLCMYMQDINLDGVKILMGNHDHLELAMKGLRCFYGDKSWSVYRKLLHVDEQALLKVVQDIKACKNVNGIQTKMFEIAEEWERTVNIIMEEAKSWKLGYLSDDQFQFRTSSICQYGDRKYETLEEMCKFFRVDNLEEILINNKPIFKNAAGNVAELEELVLNSSKKFPQLLSYAVEYAAKNDSVDWDKFKPYFIDKILEDTTSSMTTRPSITWVDVIKMQEVARCESDSAIYFVRPKNHPSTNICPQDLINLGKKFLDIIRNSLVDILVADPESMWTIMVSKQKKRIICIAPKVTKEGSLNGCYPVFVKPLL